MTLVLAIGQDSPDPVWTWLSGLSVALTVMVRIAVPLLIVSSSPEALAAFREWLKVILRKHFADDYFALAEAIRIHPRSLRRTLSAESEYTLSLEHCLKLARALKPQVSALTVLQKADKRESLDDIEELIGRLQLSAADDELLHVAAALDPAKRDQLLTFARFLQQEGAAVRKPRKPKTTKPTKP